MKRAVFEIKQTPSGSYYFIFKESTEETQVVSCSFPDRAELEKCLSGIRDTAPLADVHSDLDLHKKLPLFVIQQQADGQIFSLIGFEGEIILSSISYNSVAQCHDAIGRLKASARKAAIIDLTVD